jgi:hypothetical protein
MCRVEEGITLVQAGEIVCLIDIGDPIDERMSLDPVLLAKS